MGDGWEDARRIESWAGETRVNLIRLAAIIGFYGNHLVQVHLLKDDQAVTGSFHGAVTTVTMAWALEVLALHVCLSRRYVPEALKYVATTCDLVLVTALLVIAATPRSMLAVLYFLVIAAAPLRLSLRLIYVSALPGQRAQSARAGGHCGSSICGGGLAHPYRSAAAADLSGLRQEHRSAVAFLPPLQLPARDTPRAL